MLSDKLKTQIYSDKYKYFNVTLSQFIRTSPEKFWRHIRPSSPITNMFISDGLVMNDNTTIANSFNDHFKSVFTDDNGSMPSCVKHERMPSISDLVLSESGILNMLLNLNKNKSMGPYCLPNAFFLGGTLSGYLSIYLSFIKKSLSEGSFPTDWKTAKIRPLHKTGNKRLVANYRPISLTCTSCKLLEHIIHNHIFEFLEENEVLTQKQHGFRRGYFTTTQLVEMTHDFASSINKGNQIDVTFFFRFCEGL